MSIFHHRRFSSEGFKKISGAQDLWRLRVGDYRVVYKVDDKSHRIDIALIRHRREVYRQVFYEANEAVLEYTAAMNCEQSRR